MANICLPSSVAVVSQTWSFQITGDDQPLPWIGCFHLMCSVSDHSVGGSAVMGELLTIRVIGLLLSIVALGAALNYAVTRVRRPA